jgi:hypothetical protein
MVGETEHMNIKPGNVAFVMHHDSKLSRLIAWFMRDKFRTAPDFSHSALVVESTENEVWLSETTDTQIAYGRLSSYLNDPRCSIEIFAPIDASAEEIAKCVEEAQNNTGKLYAYWQLISWAIVCLGAKLGVDIPNILPFGWVCNSHVLDGIRHFKAGPFYMIKQQSIHTMRMYAMMKESTAWVSVFSKRVFNDGIAKHRG